MGKRKNKILKLITLFFLFIMPIFDTIWFYSKWTTAIRVLSVGIILLSTLMMYKQSRKPFFFLLGYYFLVFIYFIINYYHSKGFFALSPDLFNYDAYQELFGIIKLITVPSLLFSLYFQGLSKKQLDFIVKSWVLMIGGSIILLNILKLSLSSYGNGLISYNIFEWAKGIYYTNTASKGFFIYANQEAIIMLLLLTISINNYLYENWRNIIYIIMLSIAMLMLGTRVSSLGGLLVATLVLILYYGYAIFKKETINKKSYLLFIPLFIWGVILFTVSPYINRNVELNSATKINAQKISINSSIPIKDSKNIIINEDNPKLELMNYVDNHANKEKMPEQFYQEYYSYEYDPEFWYEFVLNTPDKDLNYRYIEKSIIKRVYEIDSRKTDVLFGISNTRIQNIMNIERDFVLHYYAYGIIGSIVLLLIYPIMLLYSIFCLKKDKDFLSIINLLNVILFVVVAFMTGNIINSINTTIAFCFIAAYIFVKKSTVNVK